MKKKLWVGVLASALMVGAILSGCNSTKLLTSWKAPNETIQSYDKVLVIALMGNQDRKLREQAENIIVKDLQANGFNAGSALAEYGPKIFEGMDEKTALTKIRDKGYDGTFTIAVVDKTKEKRYNPSRFGYAPFNYYGWRFWGYYNNFYNNFHPGFYEPGYYSTTNKFVLEGNFYNLKTDKLVYSAQTKTVDPASPQSLATAFSKRVFDDMREKSLIKK